MSDYTYPSHGAHHAVGQSDAQGEYTVPMPAGQYGAHPPSANFEPIGTSTTAAYGDNNTTYNNSDGDVRPAAVEFTNTQEEGMADRFSNVRVNPQASHAVTHHQSSSDGKASYGNPIGGEGYDHVEKPSNTVSHKTSHTVSGNADNHHDYDSYAANANVGYPTDATHDPAALVGAEPPSYSHAVATTAVRPDSADPSYGSTAATHGSSPPHISQQPHARMLCRDYSGAPPELPPMITDTTPDVWFRDHQAQMKRDATDKEEERLRGLRQKKEDTKGGVSYKLGKFFSNTSASVSKSVGNAQDSREETVWDNNMKQAKARLVKYWHHQNADSLIVEFDCEGIHKNRPTRGHILLTQTSLCFLGKGSHQLVIVEEIPLADIVSYAKGVSVPCMEKDARWVMDVPNLFVRPDAVQIFTRQGSLFHFISITHPILKASSAIPGTNISDGHDDVNAYDRFLNYFDHAWRNATRVSPNQL